MGRLKLQMQITVDGMNPEGVDQDLSWDEVKIHSLALLRNADTIVLGGKTAAEFIPYWDRIAERPDEPWNDVAKLISGARKVVFSKSAEGREWKNTTIERGDLVEAVEALKRAGGKDIIVYGGVTLVASLVAKHLIDEFHLFVNPLALGSGRSIFSELSAPQTFKLKNAIGLGSGHVLLHYE